MVNQKTVLFCCMDERHGVAIEEAIRKQTGITRSPYRLTWPGGAGALTELDPEVRASHVRNIKEIAIGALHCEKIFLTVHGTSHEDNHGCGGYILGGFAEAYETPEKSRAFSFDQLKKAAAYLREQGIVVPIEAYYVTFAADGSNMVEKVSVEESEMSPLTITKEVAFQP
jgi:hypothetical protein